MEKNKFVFSLIFVLACILLVSNALTIEESGIFLGKGKNNISFNNTNYFYVSDLIKLNPSIDAVSFYEGSKSIGYINFLEGLGNNFVVRNNINYEIFMKENATLVLPY